MLKKITTENKMPGKRILRKMKYLSDQKGILNRYLAEGNHWNPHLEKTRKFLEESLGDDHYRAILVIGSGWLLDVPLESLAGQCKNLYVLDIHHPPQILHKIRYRENVHALTADVTGGAIRGAYDFIRVHRKSCKGTILDIKFKAAIPAVGADYIISLNVLNQLDILLVDYLKKHIEIPGNEEVEFRRRIQQQHCSLLSPGRSCLVTDVEEHLLDRKGQQVRAKNLIYCELPGGRRSEEWTWLFDSRGTYQTGHRTRMRVQAIQL